MSLARSVGRNTAVQFVGKIVGTVLGVITAAIIQRYLKPEGYGSYTAAMAYVSFFSVVADLGLYLILIRELNKPGTNASQAVGNMLGLRWTSAIIILVGSALISWFLPFYSPAVKSAIQIGALSFIAVAGTQLLVAVFQTHLQTLWVTIAEVSGRVVLLGLVIAVTFMSGSLNWLMAAVAVGSLVNLGLMLISAKKYVELRPRFEFAYWRTIIRDTLPVSISIVLSLIYFKADTILLNVFNKGNYAVGLYGAAYKVLEILITFPTIFVGLILPSLGRTFSSDDKPGFIRVFQRSFEILTILATPILVGGWILSTEILVAIGKQDYAPASGVLRLLLIAVTMSFLNSLSAHTITIINRQRQMVWGYLTVAAVGLITYISLIPSMSYTGAAIGTILTETLTPLIGYIIIFRVMKFRLQLSVIPKTILAAAIMAVTIILLRPVNPWLALVVASGLYAGVIIGTRAVPWQMVKEVIGRPTEIEVLPPS